MTRKFHKVSTLTQPEFNDNLQKISKKFAKNRTVYIRNTILWANNPYHIERS